VHAASTCLCMRAGKVLDATASDGGRRSVMIVAHRMAAGNKGAAGFVASISWRRSPAGICN